MQTELFPLSLFFHSGYDQIFADVQKPNHLCLNWLIVPLVKLPVFYLTVLLGCSRQIPTFTWNPNAVSFPLQDMHSWAYISSVCKKWDSSFSRTIGYGFTQTYYSGFNNAEMLEMELCMVWAEVQSLPLSFLKYLHCGEIVLILSPNIFCGKLTWIRNPLLINVRHE